MAEEFEKLDDSVRRKIAKVNEKLAALRNKKKIQKSELLDLFLVDKQLDIIIEILET